MSRYVTKKHGIVIGSGNTFFFAKENGEWHETKCLFSLRGYRCTQINMVNVALRTPAEQLLYVERPVTDAEAEKINDYTHRIAVEITPHMARWMDINTPGWAIPPHAKRCDIAIFFQKRAHALALSNYINQMLDGLHIHS